MAVKGWIDGDESAADMLSRVSSQRPFLLVPPLHRVPLRVGNVVELAGPSSSAKTHILMQAAVNCMLPKDYGGLERLVLFIDLDCRFDVTRLSEMLKHRIMEPIGGSMCDHEEFYASCMRRFLYVRCYNSLEFLATLKTLHHRLNRETEMHDVNMQLLIIDSIGPFRSVDRGSTFFPLGSHNRNDYMLEASDGSSVTSSKQRPPYREFMPPIWQSLITHKILVRASDDNMPITLDQEDTSYFSEWLLPSLGFQDKFVVKDAGIFIVS